MRWIWKLFYKNKICKIISIAVPNIQKLHLKILAHNLNLKRLLTLVVINKKSFGNLVGNFFTYNPPSVQSGCRNCIQYNSIELHSTNNFLPTILIRCQKSPKLMFIAFTKHDFCRKSHFDSEKCFSKYLMVVEEYISAYFVIAVGKIYYLITYRLSIL